MLVKDNLLYHPFRVRGACFLLDVEKTALYSITPELYRRITGDEEENGRKPDISFWDSLSARAEWYRLKRKLRQIPEQDKRSELEAFQTKNEGLSAIMLGVSHLCDLKCEYCLANEPEFLGTKKLMSAQTAMRSIDFLIGNSRYRNTFSVNFFGGEPLLNRPVMRATVDYCRKKEKELKKNFVFRLFTNGYSLSRDVYEEFKDDLYLIHVSMDGLPEIHDRHRKTKKGEGSWDTIKRNVQSIPGFAEKFIVSVVITDDDTDLVACIESLREVGFRRNSIAFQRVFSHSSDGDLGIKSNLDAWKKRFMELIDYNVRNTASIAEISDINLQLAITGLLDKKRSYYNCPFGKSAVYIDPKGNIYPCERLVTKDASLRMGSLDDFSGIDEKRKFFFESNILSNKNCSSCWARFICGGPCFVDSYFVYGNYDTPDNDHCERIKYLFYGAALLADHFSRKGDRFMRKGNISDDFHHVVERSV